MTIDGSTTSPDRLEPPVAPDTRTPAGGRSADRPASGLALVAAACSAAAGLAHAAMTPTHVAEWPTEGRAFAILAVAQLVAAAAVVLRPGRASFAALVAVQVPAIAGWAWSRTTGLPFGPNAGSPESIGWVDAVTTALEVGALLLGLRLLVTAAGHDDDGHAHSVRPPAWAALASFVVVAGVAGLVASPEGQHGHGGDDAQEHAHAGPPALTVPLTPAVRGELGRELTVAREVALRHPTVADATEAGLMQAGPFTPGSASHFVDISVGMAEDFDLEKPLAWLYSGTNPDSVLVGVMYYTATNDSPEGFEGPLDVWHQHSGACYRLESDGTIFVPFSPDHDGTKPECEKAGGEFIEQTGWMVHAWVAPGWDSPQGVFSHDHPEVLCKDGRGPDEVTDLAVGCEGI